MAFYEEAVIRVCWPVHVFSLAKDRTAADVLLVRPLALKEGIVKMMGIVFCHIKIFLWMHLMQNAVITELKTFVFLLLLTDSVASLTNWPQL